MAFSFPEKQNDGLQSLCLIIWKMPAKTAISEKNRTERTESACSVRFCLQRAVSPICHIVILLGHIPGKIDLGKQVLEQGAKRIEREPVSGLPFLYLFIVASDRLIFFAQFGQRVLTCRISGFTQRFELLLLAGNGKTAVAFQHGQAVLLHSNKAAA